MSEWVTDDRGGICEQCESAYQSLSQYWARSRDCSHRPVADEMADVVRGCLLGDGNLDNPNDGPPSLRISSTRREHIEWIHDLLGWLSRGVTKDSSGAYRLRTMAHPYFGRFWTWQTAPPREGWTLTRQIARIWYACDGTLEQTRASADPRIAWTITDDQKCDAVVRVLREEGYDPIECERRVALSSSNSEQWLEWIAPAPPGSEYKWRIKQENP